MACFLLLAYERLMVCCLFGRGPSLFVCCHFHGQFPWCAGVRPDEDEARLVAFLRVTVARGDQGALGDVGSDPEK
jgi:hypothetical protein